MSFVVNEKTLTNVLNMVLNLCRVNHENIRTTSFDVLTVSLSQTFDEHSIKYINFAFLYNLEQVLVCLVSYLSILIRILMLSLRCILSKNECPWKVVSQPKDPLCNVELPRESRFVRKNENRKAVPSKK